MSKKLDKDLFPKARLKKLDKALNEIKKKPKKTRELFNILSGVQSNERGRRLGSQYTTPTVSSPSQESPQITFSDGSDQGFYFSTQGTQVDVNTVGDFSSTISDMADGYDRLMILPNDRSNMTRNYIVSDIYYRIIDNHNIIFRMILDESNRLTIRSVDRATINDITLPNGQIESLTDRDGFIISFFNDNGVLNVRRQS